MRDRIAVFIGAVLLMTNLVSAQTTDVPPQFRPWSFEFAIANVFDSNVNQDAEDQDSVGIVYGAGVHYQNRHSHPLFELDYQINQHSYSNTERWDRISNDFVAVYEPRLSKKLFLEIEGEVNLKGSTEDHEIANQYIVKPQITFRLTDSTRVNTYVAYRIKRYDQELGRDSSDNYAGLEIEQRIGNHAIEAGYRYDSNDADDPRNDYIRWTYDLIYTLGIGDHNEISFEARYRPQNYTQRLVDVGDTKELRSDRRWVLVVSSVISLVEGHLDLIPRYKYERRSSNDDRKEFHEHLPSVALRYTW